MTYIHKGEQFWNDDHTEGYEITEDVEPNTPVMSRQFKALGNASEAKQYHKMPQWLEEIILRSGGVEAYRKRNNITKT